MYHEERMLPVKITPDQRTDLEKRNATIDIDVIVANEALDAAKGIFKEKTEGIKKEKSGNVQILRQGYENKLVKVAEYFNEDTATVDYVDEEGEEIHSRPMTMDERRQYKIKFNKRHGQDA